MADRFYTDEPIDSGRVRLMGPEAHHAIHVMRCRVGDELTLFDGNGAEFAVRVVGLERAAVEVAVLERRIVDRELPYRIILGVALPKGDRQRWLVEKSAELGVDRIVPLVTSRSVATPTAKSLDRLRRVVIEASKQCGRNRLMKIDTPQPLRDFLCGITSEVFRVLADLTPQARPLESVLSQWQGNDVAIGIGPEGGFTDDERALGEAWQTVSLGPRKLRIETAAVSMAAAFGFRRP